MSSDQQQVVTALIHSFLATPFIARDELAQQITDIGFRNGLAPNALTIDQFLELANQRLETLNLKISSIKYEVDERAYCALINTKASDAGKATQLDKDQVDFFKILVDHITQRNGALAQMDARNMFNKKEMKADRADQTLHTLAQQGWLHLKQGYYHLGVRTYVELRTMIEDYGECNVCQEACILNVKCANRCAGLFHGYCIAGVHKKTPPERRMCPYCQQKWQ